MQLLKFINSARRMVSHLKFETHVMQAEGVTTAAGTWALNETEARMIEKTVDGDERWEKSLEGKDQWINKPLQPPGLLRSGENGVNPKTRSWDTITYIPVTLLDARGFSSLLRSAGCCSHSFLILYSRKRVFGGSGAAATARLWALW